jgi:tetratricopeptide (TPR) repeat protein
MNQQSLAAFNQVGNRRGAAADLSNLGDLQVEMGNLGEARDYYAKSLALAREISFSVGEPYPVSGLGDVALAQGDLAGARRQYEQALALCNQLKKEDYAAQLGVALAAVDLAEKRFADGVSLARQAAVVLESDTGSGEAWAQALLSRNLLGVGNLAEARGRKGHRAFRENRGSKRALRGRSGRRSRQGEVGQIGRSSPGTSVDDRFHPPLRLSPV